MAGFTMVYLQKIKSMDMEYYHGLMVESIRVLGKEESNMELVYSLTERVSRGLVNGSTVRELSGMMRMETQFHTTKSNNTFNK